MVKIMDYKKQKEIFDREAPLWDSKDKGDNTQNIKRVISMSQIKQGMKVLDVGCGTGIMEKELALAVGDKGLVKAIDISTGMLNVAKEKFSAYKNIVFEEQNIEFITEEKESYDAVICNNVFPHFVHPDKVAENCFRLLKPGGVFTVSHLKGRAFVNNIHRDTENFQEDRVPVPSKWVSLFEKHGFTEKISIDENDFYIIINLKSPKF